METKNNRNLTYAYVGLIKLWWRLEEGKGVIY